MEDLIQYKLFEYSNGLLFNIPPMASTAGHRAEDWRGKCVWKGLIQMFEAGETAKIIFRDSMGGEYGSGTLPIMNYEKHIERCVDSSRFFAIRMLNPKNEKYVLVGIGFDDRNPAFDFINSLSNAKEQREVANNPTPYSSEGTSQAFQLREGEKININVDIFKQTQTGGSTTNHPKKKLGGLMAPPKAKKTQAYIQKAQVVSQPKENDPPLPQPVGQELEELGDLLLGNPRNQVAPKEESPQNFPSSNINNLLDL